MIRMILEHFIFLAAIFMLFFVPGALWLRVIMAEQKSTANFLLIEFLLFSFVLSLALVDFGMILLSKIGVPLSQLSIGALGALSIGIPAGILLVRKNLRRFRTHDEHASLLLETGFTRQESFFFIGAVFVMLLFKSAFLWNTILPTSTDLGHHMYWVKAMTETHTLPIYQKINIAFENDENTLTPPEPIDDFIIGEHLPFAALALILDRDVISSFPSLFLLLVNILTPLALAVLAYRLFEEMCASRSLARRGMLVALFLAGPLWTLSSPEAKYVSGGVIGNLFGNLLIPITLLALFRALRERDSRLLSIAALSAGTLAFTHHLSTLVFGCIILFSLAAFLALKRRSAIDFLGERVHLFVTPDFIFSLGALICITVFVYAPTYLDIAAIDTALGTPSKATREGLEFSELAASVGSSRLGLELMGIMIILLSPARKTLAGALGIGWSGGLIVMSLFPGALFLDIPSNRVATYGTFPAALIAAFSITTLFFRTKRKLTETSMLLQASFSVIVAAVIAGGFFDNSASIPRKTNSTEAVQTYAASRWLADRTPEDAWILKDHNYIAADSWMKLFFMRDYSYPLSRGYFRRYADEVTVREQCTLLMISAPNTPKGKACFETTGVTTLVVNPRYDAAQFVKSKDASLVYVSNDIAVFTRADSR